MTRKIKNNKINKTNIENILKSRIERWTDSSENPNEINSVYWDEETKSWKDKMIKVDEYFGFTECQRCRKPMSHNIKTEGQFKMVYVRCGCSTMSRS